MVKAENNTIDDKIKLSFTQLDNYLTCPLLYKLRYVLKIKTPKAAAPSFGQVVHETLQHFYELVLQKKKVDKKTLLEKYENSWKPDGYKDKMDELSYKRKGEEQLSNYYDRYEKFPTTPLFVEKKFIFSLGDIRISGKIDRIDKAGGNKINIIDYKTGNVKKQSDADNDLQMSIYAAASETVFPGKVVGEFIFYFLKTNEVVKTERTDEQIEETKQLITSTAEEIRDKKFDPVEGYHCNWCPYTWICPAKQPLQTS